MPNKNTPSKLNLNTKIVLAIVGGIVIIMSAQMSRYRFFSQTDIYNYIIPVIIGVILISPFVIYWIKSK
ncbi:hypothetical protein [Flavobacteriaceae bacterium 14752]|uniref:hypothetical protein n=1 Tax=Mesohalobacter salilacus TaxID=2491711 RepID=UPI000F630887|nr:hypothetical protein EIG84_11480 [Flavobacteriaceae bacterium 14752]